MRVDFNNESVKSSLLTDIALFCYITRAYFVSYPQLVVWIVFSFIIWEAEGETQKDMYPVFFFNKILLLPLDVEYEFAIRTTEISVHSNLGLRFFEVPVGVSHYLIFLILSIFSYSS